MKKLILLLSLILATASSASAFDFKYKGYGELNGGAFFANQYYGSGGLFGISTSHGLVLMDGLFVGAGIDLNYITFSEPGYYSYERDYDYGATFAVFAEGRYNFIHKRKVNPFVGLRIGGGYEGVQETGSFYFSPAVGVSINLTEKFGLDASLAYSLWTSSYDSDDPGKSANAFNGISVRVGVHF